MIPIQHKLSDPQSTEDINQLVLEASAIFKLIDIIADFAIWEKALNSSEFRVTPVLVSDV
jgi:hypothetical protein